MTTIKHQIQPEISKLSESLCTTYNFFDLFLLIISSKKLFLFHHNILFNSGEDIYLPNSK